jgi:hypothetical protein
LLERGDDYVLPQLLVVMLGLWVLGLEAGVAIAGQNLPQFKAIARYQNTKGQPYG